MLLGRNGKSRSRSRIIGYPYFRELIFLTKFRESVLITRIWKNPNFPSRIFGKSRTPTLTRNYSKKRLDRKREAVAAEAEGMTWLRHPAPELAAETAPEEAEAGPLRRRHHGFRLPPHSPRFSGQEDPRRLPPTRIR